MAVNHPNDSFRINCLVKVVNNSTLLHELFVKLIFHIHVLILEHTTCQS